VLLLPLQCPDLLRVWPLALALRDNVVGAMKDRSLPGLAPSVVAQHKVVTRAREGMTMPAVRPVFWAETLLPEQWSDTPSGHRRC
jgi:hypothetical protein